MPNPPYQTVPCTMAMNAFSGLSTTGQSKIPMLCYSTSANSTVTVLVLCNIKTTFLIIYRHFPARALSPFVYISLDQQEWISRGSRPWPSKFPTQHRMEIVKRPIHGVSTQSVVGTISSHTAVAHTRRMARPEYNAIHPSP